MYHFLIKVESYEILIRIKNLHFRINLNITKIKIESFQHILNTTKKDLIKFKKNDGYYSLLIVAKTFYFFCSFLSFT